MQHRSHTRGVTLASTLAAAALLAGCGVGMVQPAIAQTAQMDIAVNKPGITVSPTLYGLMTEEINHSYDGGVYGEAIQNRIFRDDANLPVHWSLVEDGGATGSISLDTTQPINNVLTTCLKMSLTSVGGGQSVGVANEGYWGVPLKRNATYHASFYAKSGDGFTGPLTIALESADGSKTYASASVKQITSQWRQYSLILKTGEVTPSTDNRIVVSGKHTGTVWLNLVSVFPPTYNNRANGNRPDLMRLLGAMKPKFLRLPGGNYLEGNSIAERFQWKKTIGPLADRLGHQSPWGYRSTDGMGLLEFLEWCQDLHMQPVLAVYAGFSLDHEFVGAGPKLQPFVQDALDEIQYVTGGPNTKWGAQRVADGHPAPFPLTYVEVGNEDFFDSNGSYEGRFAQFFDAIKAEYPKIKIIATAQVKTRIPDVVDDHYYRSAAEMARDANHYDSYSRTGPKIFVGEWASTEGNPTPTLQAALGDAAWMTGMERNSDLILIQSYAPLLVNVNNGASQWGTNLIGYDALHSFGSPSYYAQKMFSTNQGNVILPLSLKSITAVSAAEAPLPTGKVGVGTWSTEAEFRNIEVTHDGTTLYKSNFANGDSDWTFGTGQWSTQDGALRQSADATGTQAETGDTTWTDYSYHLQARKISGKEGFLIIFHAKDDANKIWWNVGGWGDTRTSLQSFQNWNSTEIGQSQPVTVDTGRWYDIRVDVAGRDIRCYLDGKLISQAQVVPPAQPDPMYATASRDLKSGDVIVKAVNTSNIPESMNINLTGVSHVNAHAVATVLQGNPDDVNSLADPMKVAPHDVVVNDAAKSFPYTFPAHSVTVLRINAKS